jgi:tetratricopeptide (TPR) repeat protein
MAVGQEGVRGAEAVQQAFSQNHTDWNLAYVHAVRGDFADALTLLERAVARAREFDLTIWRPWLDWSLGHVYALSGRVEEGLPLLEQGLAFFEEAWGGGAFHPLVSVHLGEAHLLAGRPDDAGTAAGRALALARARGEPGFEALARHLLGEIVAHPDRPNIDAAEAEYVQALALAEELGMRPLQAHCHLGLGKLYRKTGRLEQARTELSAVVDLYREMGMTYWLPQAEAELAEAATPLPSP